MSGSDVKPAAMRSALGKAPILRAAPSEALDALAQAGTARFYGRGTYVFHQGDPSDHILCLIDGRLEVSSVAPSGHRKLHALVEVPQLVGELGILGETPRTATVLAVDESMVWVAPADAFVAFLAGAFDATRELLRVLSSQVQSHEAFAEDLLHLDLKGRVAKRLLQLAAAGNDGPPEDGAMVPISMTHGDLASLCGGSRENVTRTLSELERRGLVERDGRRYRILNVRALSRLAGL